MAPEKARARQPLLIFFLFIPLGRFPIFTWPCCVAVKDYHAWYPPDSNSASYPEDSSDQDVPASEVARESPENNTTCEYHGLLQAAEDTDQLLFVAFEGRRIRVQQLLDIVGNSDRV